MLATQKEPRALGRLRRISEGKLVVLGFGCGSMPVGIFTCIESAVWSIRHYGPFDPAKTWWLYFYDRDRLDPEAGQTPLRVPDEVVEWVLSKRLAP